MKQKHWKKNKTFWRATKLTEGNIGGKAKYISWEGNENFWRKAKKYLKESKKYLKERKTNIWRKVKKNFWRAKNIRRKAKIFKGKKKPIWRRAKQIFEGKQKKNIWRKAKNIWMNIEEKQKYLRESKKKIHGSKNIWSKVKIPEGKQSHFKRILIPRAIVIIEQNKF